ncbi:hypothetical protein Agub_g1434 [Astrephomene gubernaculifera]|uniref:RNA polymerase sigma-70 domain-containing protein n=1 Tax=Astrephomene gubernaculifera TaxID=47775 RepID=A0AAD3DFE1_9CHLO|nr:hypothetical protein Agub_g1434 [Astrephomene gubernaculifera]
MNFHEYTQATQMLNRLKGQASDLEVLLDQLNALEASLDDNLLAPPPLDEAAERAARQAKRAAKRAERKAKATTAAVSGSAAAAAAPPSTSSTLLPAAPEPSVKPRLQPTSSRTISTSSSASSSLSTSLPSSASNSSSGSSNSSSAAADVMQLEELFKLTYDEEPPALPAPKSPTSPMATLPTILKPAAAAATGSSSLLRPRKAVRKPSAAPPPPPDAAAAPPATTEAAATTLAPTQMDSLSLDDLEMLLPPLQTQQQQTAPLQPESEQQQQQQRKRPSRPEAQVQAVLAPPQPAATPTRQAPAAGRQLLRDDTHTDTDTHALQQQQQLLPQQQQRSHQSGQQQQQRQPEEQRERQQEEAAALGMLESLVSADQEEDAYEDVHAAGPSDEDLRQLEFDLQLADDSWAGGSTLLEAAAMAPRGARQLSQPSSSASSSSASPASAPLLPAGPSLLSLVPASAAPGRSAKVRQARRSARYSHSSAGAQGGSGAAGGAEAAGAGRSSRSKDSTTQFLTSSTSVDFLDVEAEREVIEVCRDYLFLEKVKRQCRKTLHRKPTQEEIAAAVGMDARSYLHRYDAGLRAKEVLLKSNYRLVMTVCRKHLRPGMQLQDLVSEGVRGLLRGVEMFDVSKGFRFGTYAHWWIRQAITRSMAVTGRAVRLPVHMIEQLSKVRTVSARLAAELLREPTAAEISAELGLPVPRIQLLLEAARAASSMDTAINGDESGGTFKDTVQDDRRAADEEFGADSLRGDMEALLGGIPEREARVLRLRFGLDDGKEWTLEEVGDVLGVTRERIRQLEAKALRRLKVASIDECGKLREYSENLRQLEEHEVTARTSSGTRKSK